MMSVAERKAYIEAKLVELGLARDGWTVSYGEAEGVAGPGMEVLASCRYSTKRLTFPENFVGLAYEPMFLDVVAHEIAHALTPGEDHGPVWAKKARELGGTGLVATGPVRATHIHVCENWCTVKSTNQSHHDPCPICGKEVKTYENTMDKLAELFRGNATLSGLMAFSGLCFISREEAPEGRHAEIARAFSSSPMLAASIRRLQESGFQLPAETSLRGGLAGNLTGSLEENLVILDYSGDEAELVDKLRAWRIGHRRSCRDLERKACREARKLARRRPKGFAWRETLVEGRVVVEIDGNE